MCNSECIGIAINIHILIHIYIQIFKYQHESKRTYILKGKQAQQYKVDLVAIKRKQFGSGFKLKPKTLVECITGWPIMGAKVSRQE